MISAGIVQQQLLFIRSFFIRIRSKRFLSFPLFLHSLFCPFPSPCNVTRDDHDIEFPGGSTLQCGTRLWDDMPLNSPKRPPYWNSTSGFDFDHITAVDMSSCTSLRNFIQIGPPMAEK